MFAQRSPLQGNKKYTINTLTVSGEQSFNEKTVILQHTYNTMLDETNTIWEEEF